MIKLKVYEWFDHALFVINTNIPRQEVNINKNFISEIAYKERPTSEFGDYKKFGYITMSNGNLYLFDPEENNGIVLESILK